MKRVMIIGCCGAGKSTFSRKLHRITQLELIHLDQHFWQANWVETATDVWKEKVQVLANKPSWIIDGNYGGTMDIRIEKADTIIYMDFPTWKCWWRVILRVAKNWRKVRPDMPPGCRERFDIGFLHYVATYNIIRRKKYLRMMDELKGQKTIHIFNTDQEVDQFLQSLEKV